MSETDGPVRADAELVRRGLARSRTHAAELIRVARVRLDGVVVVKAATPVTGQAALTVELDDGPTYASRAGLKLAGVLRALGPHGPRIEGADCLDVGASTGGFTDVLLRHGARRVLAIDVGHGQLVPELRADPRVEVREGLNARDLDRTEVPAAPDVIVGDLSFISLRTVLPALERVGGAGTDLLLMVKPQFEVGRERLGRGGVVRSEALRATAVTGVIDVASQLGIGAQAVIPSSLPGPSGNLEYFVWLRPGPAAAGIPAAVANAVAWDPGAGEAPPVAWLIREPGAGPERLGARTTTQGDL